MGLRELSISFLLAGLFVVAIINFGVMLNIDGNTNVSILDNDLINRSFADLQTELIAANEEIDGESGLKGVLLQEEPKETQTGFTLAQGFAIVKLMTLGFISGIFNILNGLIFIPFGISGTAGQVIFGVVSSIMLIITISYGWRFYRTGQ